MNATQALRNDVDFPLRFQTLITLMEQFPHAPMFELQEQALEKYPIDCPIATKIWFAPEVAFAASDIANIKFRD